MAATRGRGRPPELMQRVGAAYHDAALVPMATMIRLLRADGERIATIHRHIEAITGVALTRSCVRKWIEKFK